MYCVCLSAYCNVQDYLSIIDCVGGGGGECISIPTFLLTSSLSPPNQQFVPVEEEDVSGHVVISTHYTAFYSESVLCWS